MLKYILMLQDYTFIYFYFSQKDVTCLMLILMQQSIKRNVKNGFLIRKEGVIGNGFQQIPQLATDISCWATEQINLPWQTFKDPSLMAVLPVLSCLPLKCQSCMDEAHVSSASACSSRQFTNLQLGKPFTALSTLRLAHL